MRIYPRLLRSQSEISIHRSRWHEHQVPNSPRKITTDVYTVTWLAPPYVAMGWWTLFILEAYPFALFLPIFYKVPHKQSTYANILIDRRATEFARRNLVIGRSHLSFFFREDFLDLVSILTGKTLYQRPRINHELRMAYVENLLFLDADFILILFMFWYWAARAAGCKGCRQQGALNNS